MSASDPKGPTQAQWSRLAGMGIEYGAVVAVFALLGWWVDRHWQIERHWGTLIGAMLGLVGGTYNFVREALRALRESERRESRRAASRPGSGRRDVESRPLDGTTGGPHDTNGSEHR